MSKKNDKFIPNNEDTKCAPSKKHIEGSCYSLESLLLMVAAFNIKCAQRKIGTPIEIRENKSYLIAKLTKALEPVCSDQLCWLEQDFIKALNNAEINDFTFLPKLSQGKFTWLNTTNIKEKMIQYEKVYKDFKFLGCVPIDFDDLKECGIRNLNFDELFRKKITKLGIIFNLDESWRSGSHWVSLFTDIEKNQIYFFDSCAKKPEKRIRNLINRMATWCYKRNIQKKSELTESVIEDSFMNNEKNFIEKVIESIKYNTVKHQRKNSECGVYSINFIFRMLNGETFEEICNNVVDDDRMNNNRQIYFRFK